MKFLRNLLIIILLIILIGFSGLYFFVWQRSGEQKLSGTSKGTTIRKAVKNFTFSAEDALREWDEKNLSKNSTAYDIEIEDGEEFVKAISENSASAIFFKERLDYKKNPYVSWSWKAEKFPSWRHGENLGKKDEFDFAAQVYVIFYARFFLKTKAIQYVWTETIPAGTVVSSPYTENVKVAVLESGSLGEWKNEDRDIREDFKNYFGEELDRDIVAVAFMTDSDSTGSEAEASYDNFSIGYIEKEKIFQGTDVSEGEEQEIDNFAKK